MQDDIKKFRLETDKFINSTKYLKGSREISLAHTNLQRGKMWLGKALGELGGPTPYPQSENPANTTIEPQADHDESNLPWDPSLSHIGKVKEFRSVLQDYIERFKKFTSNSESAGKNYDLYLQTSLLAIEEAKMWFGWELDRIRNEELNPVTEVKKAPLPVTGLNFGRAIEAMKEGKFVSREGWNGKGMYLWLLPAAEVKKEWVKDPILLKVFGEKDVLACLGSIRMFTATGEVLTGWLASQTDMLAEDWCILN